MSSETLVLLLVIFWVPVVVASSFVTPLLAGAKGRSVIEGFLAGLFLGVIGLLIEDMLPARPARAVGAAATSPMQTPFTSAAQH